MKQDIEDIVTNIAGLINVGVGRHAYETSNELIEMLCIPALLYRAYYIQKEHAKAKEDENQ